MVAFIIIAVAILLIYAVWQYQELKKFEITQYEMSTSKVNKKIKLVVISDLHSFTYGTGNGRLLEAVREQQPDLILIPGDLIVSASMEKYDISAKLAKNLVRIAPVIYCNGNHESHVQQDVIDEEIRQAYQDYRRQLSGFGVIFLNNEQKEFQLPGGRIRVSGVELPLSCYKKWKKPKLASFYLQDQLGRASTDELQVLLAHHPAFAEQYAEWGADVTVCGHNHGGLIRLPGLGSIFSPQFIPFPKYDAGEFTIAGRKVYISRGLGTHTLHIRIFNRAELAVITVQPDNCKREM